MIPKVSDPDYGVHHQFPIIIYTMHYIMKKNSRISRHTITAIQPTLYLFICNIHYNCRLMDIMSCSSTSSSIIHLCCIPLLLAAHPLHGRELKIGRPSARKRDNSIKWTINPSLDAQHVLLLLIQTFVIVFRLNSAGKSYIIARALTFIQLLCMQTIKDAHNILLTAVTLFLLH